MLYAQVVLGLPIEGPFDYIVPADFTKRIKVGVRVRVDFRAREMVGYAVKLTNQTRVKQLKPILEVIDDSVILDKNMLLLTRELSDYYACSWGEAIEAALPLPLRKGRTLPKINHVRDKTPKASDGCLRQPVSNGVNSQQIPMADFSPIGKKLNKKEVILIHDLDGNARWDIYLKQIKETLDNNMSVIVLLPDISSVLKVKEIIKAKLGISPGLLYRRQLKELEEWAKIREGKFRIVLGTRSAIFAPLKHLGLVIIDEEQDTVYKQDQSPHYNAREVAFMRVNLEKAKLILGSTAPSLESFYLAKKNKIKYMFISRSKNFPAIKIIETRTILSKYLMDLIIASLNLRQKILLFLNRKGFATFASCHNCGIVLKCPRCNINLVYHFKDNILSCHYCNFKMVPYKICPNCNSGYIRYSGIGTEKMESELARLLPQAKIKRLDTSKELDLENIDILISTKHIIKETVCDFDLIAILAIDNSLNRPDLRSGEKTFGLLVNLSKLTQKTLVIQTRLPNHHCFKALENKDINIFYHEELKQRRQLNFPPYSHIGLVKLRGKNEVRVREVSLSLFKRLNRYSKNKDLKIVSVNPAQTPKLRGNFYWQILIMADRAKKISRFLKIYLKEFSHSGIIVTVDIDPL